MRASNRRRGASGLRKVAVCGALLLAASAMASCTFGTKGSPPVTTDTRTVTHTRTPAATFVPAPAQSVAPLPPHAAPAAGEIEKPCPYIASTPAQDANVNVADIEGDHVYRTTVLTGTQPVGCRFYFYAGPFEAIADIVPRTFPDARSAHNAMVLTAEAGTQAQGQPNFVPGVDAVLFRTTFFGPDGDQDWACAFAKGTVLVVVHTQRNDTSHNALLLAQAIVGKF
jgi:hypothetical protein